MHNILPRANDKVPPPCLPNKVLKSTMNYTQRLRPPNYKCFEERSCSSAFMRSKDVRGCVLGGAVGLTRHPFVLVWLVAKTHEGHRYFQSKHSDMCSKRNYRFVTTGTYLIKKTKACKNYKEQFVSETLCSQITPRMKQRI